MKKLMTLFLACGLVMAAYSGAQAADVRFSGQFDFAFEGYSNLNGSNSFMDNSDYLNNNGSPFHNNHFGAVQRIRLGMDIVASEQLSGYVQLQIGTFTWGGPGRGVDPQYNSGGMLGSVNSDIAVRQAYLDWIVPNTKVKVRMGLQSITGPGYAITSPILDSQATGIVVSAPFYDDMFAVDAYWIRAISDSQRGSNSNNLFDQQKGDFDLFGLNFTANYDMFSVKPWVMVGSLGESADRVSGASSIVSGSLPVTGYTNYQNGGITDPSGSTVWFAGITGQTHYFDPFYLAMDFYYSGTKNDNKSTERSGWYLAAKASYKMEYAVPTLTGWYASGDNGDKYDGSERPLTLVGGFNPGATTYFQGVYGIANTVYRGDAGGTWGISAQINDISFMEKLSHSLRATYIQGTNDSKMVQLNSFNGDGWRMTPANYLTDKDHLIEVDFDSTYQIYKDLATVLELSYLFQDFDKNVWMDYSGAKADFSDAWRAALNFRYTF